MWEIYWITRVCYAHAIFETVGIICEVMAVILLMGWCFLPPEDIEVKLRKWMLRSFLCGLISLFIAALLPDKKEMMLIFGGGAVYEYVKDSEKVKKLPDNAVKALNDWLENDKKEE